MELEGILGALWSDLPPRREACCGSRLLPKPVPTGGGEKEAWPGRGCSLSLLTVKERPLTLGHARPARGGTEGQQPGPRHRFAQGFPGSQEKGRCRPVDLPAGPPGGSQQGKGPAAEGTVRQLNLAQGAGPRGWPRGGLLLSAPQAAHL